MKIDELLSEAKTVAIFGHVRPDGDCVGSTTGIYNYIKDNYPGISVDLYLENFPDSYKILRGACDAQSAWTAAGKAMTEFGDRCEKIGKSAERLAER